MEDPHPESGLLRLPRELRDEIYTYLSRHEEPLPDPSQHGGRIELGYVMYPGFYKSWWYPSVIWVNRQLRREYMEMSSSLQFKSELDIVPEGYLFYPTWTHIDPSITSGIPSDLNVTLRVFSTVALESHDGWPPQHGTGFRSLLRLLNEFACYGPSFGCNAGRKIRMPVCINRLSIHIVFDRCLWDDWVREAAHNVFRMLKALALNGVPKGIENDSCSYRRSFSRAPNLRWGVEGLQSI